jgi:hypothetical protein
MDEVSNLFPISTLWCKSHETTPDEERHLFWRLKEMDEAHRVQDALRLIIAQDKAIRELDELRRWNLTFRTWDSD